MLLYAPYIQFLKPPWRVVCRDRPDYVATKGEHNCQNATGSCHPQRFGAFFTCLELNLQEHRIVVQNGAFRFTRSDPVPGEVAAVDFDPFELNLSPLHSDNCIGTVVT
jgi:hypothetical protein